VELKRSGKTVEVQPGTSIVEALRAVGVAVDTSCEDGICGTCETRILEGIADHRDSVLTKKEQEAGRSMMICVSRCKGDKLVLDL
jgi:ferredoxin